jgi:hypothetical protein
MCCISPSQKRQGIYARTLVALVALVWWSTTLTVVVSFLPPQPSSSSSHSLSHAFHSWTLSSSQTTECETAGQSFAASASQQPWLERGLLLSSFTDGLKLNPPAVEWLMNALVETLWKEKQATTQDAVKESNLASPCNGPDPVLLGQLEDTDRAVDGMGSASSLDWKNKLQLLCETKKARKGETKNSVDLRVLYIPTAMYALRPGSTSKPGKQRGRNRADGKKRRNELLRLLQGQLEGFCGDGDSDTTFAVRTVTMDFDDDSVKQPEEVVVGGTTPAAGTDFPASGKEAIRDWKPHLVYVQGGNTFWLHHCMEKGDWAEDVTNACCIDSSDESSFSAVYCGVSAGAILAGESMQTACWKVRHVDMSCSSLEDSVSRCVRINSHVNSSSDFFLLSNRNGMIRPWFPGKKPMTTGPTPGDSLRPAEPPGFRT